jgi:hypothetical protein
MPVTVESPDMVALVRKLGTVSKDAPKAFQQTLSTVARASKTEAKRAAVVEYNLSQKRVEDGLVIRQENGAVVIVGRRKPITIRSYGARQTKKKGVIVKVLKSGGRESIRDGFSPVKFNGVPFRRLGKSQYPIAPIVGPSVADMLNNAKVYDPLGKRLIVRASDELNRRITRALASG